MGSKHSKKSNKSAPAKRPTNEKEFLEMYGRLDWAPQGNTVEELAEGGKRYEGLQILMNRNSGEILECRVVEVTTEGFFVRPKFAESDPDFIQLIRFGTFFKIFLKGFD